MLVDLKLIDKKPLLFLVGINKNKHRAVFFLRLHNLIIYYLIMFKHGYNPFLGPYMGTCHLGTLCKVVCPFLTRPLNFPMFGAGERNRDRKSTRLNSSHSQ